jgi:manganese oxidase
MNETAQRHGRDGEAKIDVIPWVAGAALLVALAGLVFAIVAIGKADDDSGSAAGMAMGEMSMGSMSPHAMEHMDPIPIEGISDPPSDEGGTQIEGIRRDGALEFELDARPVWWPILADQEVSAYAYNGIVPGPEIRVGNGERVRVKFTNDLPVETTVHWHGIGVPNSEDGVPGVTQEPIAPGESYTYEFTARPAGDPNGGGTFLYHSHVDEDRQMAAGLAGSFIIDPPRTESGYEADETLVVSEWTADSASGRTRGVMDMEGMLPNFFTINGKSFPDTEPVEVNAGERVLLRLVNAGQFEHPLHLHGTSFEVVARDGHPTGDDSLRDTITLASGERADIAFELPPGKWAFHCHIGHHLTNDGEGPGGLMTIVEASRPTNEGTSQ